ncbi:hypothetical protein A4A49_02934 [Nicotiana attenuata]|uniref:Uncharacterized protein n=1 Tax=Nicotiana attenuata TaxID=49451 RepID=A0A314LDA2_NICAT|nr:hypothetical protein A4A49_02934 [Nicotiana attenuata]
MKLKLNSMSSACLAKYFIQNSNRKSPFVQHHPSLTFIGGDDIFMDRYNRESQVALFSIRHGASVDAENKDA